MGDERLRRKWEESKDEDSLWTESELVRMVGLSISWWVQTLWGWLQGL